MENNILLDKLSDKDKENVLNKLSELEIQDSMNTYNSLVQRCFNECITIFRSKDLDSNEKTCVNSCVAKFMDFSRRIGLHFAEKNRST
ncbi:Tim10/DDP zinc finger domain-containing protein [Cryptosporidium serpentis]